MRREALTSQRARVRRRKKLALTSAVIGVVFVVIIAGIIWLTHLDALQVKNIEISGAHDEFETMIRSDIEERLSKKVLFVLPKSNTYLFSTRKLDEWISQHAHVKDAVVSRKNFQTLVVEVRERVPVALWCSGEAPHESIGDVGVCLFVDETGYMFSEAPYFFDHVYFELYGEPIVYKDDTEALLQTATSSTKIQEENVVAIYLGKKFLPSEVFERVMTFALLLEDVGLQAHTLVVEGPERVEYIVAPENTKIITMLASDPLTTVNDVRTALDTKLLENPGADIEDIAYIDARFSDKIIFRFK